MVPKAFMIDANPSLPENAVFRHQAGPAPRIHFYGATGFALGAYDPLLGRLGSRFALSALALRPTWPEIGPPPRRRDWGLYAEDLVAFLEQEVGEPVIGVGHSMGATSTVLAARSRPDLFRALVLVEPAMVSRFLAGVSSLLPKVLMSRIEPARSTLAKRDRFADRAALRESYRAFRGYRRFSEEALLALAEANGVAIEGGDALGLAFPKDWEAHSYTRPPYMLGELGRLEVPHVAIRAKPSVFLGEALWRGWQRRCPDAIFVERPDYGHLLPLEAPDVAAELIFDAVDALSARTPGAE